MSDDHNQTWVPVAQNGENVSDGLSMALNAKSTILGYFQGEKMRKDTWDTILKATGLNKGTFCAVTMISQSTWDRYFKDDDRMTKRTKDECELILFTPHKMMYHVTAPRYRKDGVPLFRTMGHDQYKVRAAYIGEVRLEGYSSFLTYSRAMLFWNAFGERRSDRSDIYMQRVDVP